MGRLGETWGGRDKRGEAGRDVGRLGETWEGCERRGKVRRDVVRLGETWGRAGETLGGGRDVGGEGGRRDLGGRAAGETFRGEAGETWRRSGETLVGRERHERAGRDVGRLGETWGGWERRG